MSKIRPSLKKIKPYIAGKNIEEVDSEVAPSSIIKLASNENPFGPSPKAASAIKQEAKNAHVYPSQHNLALKEALAKKLKLSVENISIGNGSDEIMQFAAAAFLNSGEEVLIAENTFSTYEFCAHLFDASPVFIPLKNSKYDLERFSQHVTSQTKLVFLCNPNNPTGTYFTHEELENFLSGLPNNVIVIIDEAYGEFVEAKDFPRSIEFVKKALPVIILRTFSKLFGLAGLRLGYGISTPEIARYLNMVKMPFNVNRLAQAAGLAALSDERFIQKSLKNNSAQKKILSHALNKMGIEHLKSEANFICLNLKQKADEVFLKLLRKGIIVRPLTSFGLPQHIRVTIGKPGENKKFIKGLSCLKN